MLIARSRHQITYAVLMVAVGSFALLQSLVVPVLGQLEREFDTSQTTVTWVLTAYLLSASVSTPLLGRLGDVVGKKRMLVLTLAALSVGSLMAALSAEHRMADRRPHGPGGRWWRASPVVRHHPRRVPAGQDRTAG